jgi:hypothetical protein
MRTESRRARAAISSAGGRQMTLPQQQASAVRDDDSTETPADRAACAVSAARLQSDRGDINASYSADRIASGEPVRKPFQHHGTLWICTSITGSGLTNSRSAEHEAYRLVPEREFDGTPTTYSKRTGNADTAAAAQRPERFLSWCRGAIRMPELCPLRTTAEVHPGSGCSASRWRTKINRPVQLGLF